MKKKRSVRFRLATKKQYDFDMKSSLSNIANQYTQHARTLTPLIRSKEMSPIEAIILISTYTDAMIAGATKTHSMTEKEIMGVVNLLLHFWKTGLFVPGPEYPYTLEQTLEAIREAEDGSENEQ